MITKILLPAALLAMILTSGCAFSVYDTPVHYRFYGSLPVPQGGDLPQISVGTIKDIRSVENHRMIMNQKNGYGDTTSGGWQAEKDLSLIVKDAISQGISIAKLDLPRDRKILITGQLVDISSSIVMGWSKGTLKMRVMVKLTAYDTVSNKIIWQDTVFGDGCAQSSWSTKDIITRVFKSALDDLVKNMLTDEYFQQQVLR